MTEKLKTPSPLKNARWVLDSRTDDFFYNEKDLVSAIEWLMNKIIEDYPEDEELLKLIDEAFEDIVMINKTKEK